MAEWRAIPCGDVDWELCGVSHRAADIVKRRCLLGPEHGGTYFETGPWAVITLGVLADMGERAWRMSARTGFGEKCADVIKATIDMAAEGRPVASTKAPDAYVPKCERESV